MTSFKIYGTVYGRHMRKRENHKLLPIDEKSLFVEEHENRIMYTCMAERRKEKDIRKPMMDHYLSHYHNIKKFQ
jgi:hypothetical protein